MKIAISGSSGFIGKYLNQEFIRQGHEVINLNRTLYTSENLDQLSQTLAGCDVVVNLAGATINHRWSKKYKQLIYDSRILTTRALVAAINNLENKPQLLISTSAVGAYPDEAFCDEKETNYGSGFLATVCRDWEAEAQRVSPEVRLVITRFGVVLAADGGAFPQMIRPYKWGLGGKIGSGQQGFSWVYIDDLVNALLFIIETKEAVGVINITAPETTTNQDFTQTLARMMNKPVFLTIPLWALRLLLGERSTLLTVGQQIYPGKLFKLGFSFHYQILEAALRRLLS